MISFQSGRSSSILPSVVFSVVIILCCLMSVVLNPIIFVFNSKRQSIAAMLFTILSTIDFFYCFTLPFVLFSQAYNVPEKGKRCFGKSEDEYWNCVFTASTDQKVSSAVMHCLDSAAVSTTGLLAIARYIQLKNPLRIVKKKIIVVLISVLFIVTFFLQLLSLFSPMEKIVYSLMIMSAININPYNLENTWQSQYLSEMITNSVFIIVQLGALVAAILAANIIFRTHKNKQLGANNSAMRKRGSIKILLTNLPSFLILLRIVFEAPLYVIARKPDEGGLYSEAQGWMIFSFRRMVPLLACTWNPAIFISLTPKSRELLRKMFRRCEYDNKSNRQRSTITVL